MSSPISPFWTEILNPFLPRCLVCESLYLLRTGPISARAGLTQRQTLVGWRESKGEKKSHLWVYLARFQGKCGNKSLSSYKLHIKNLSFSPNVSKIMRWTAHICRCTKPNVFIDASSFTSCHGRHDFPTATQITDVLAMKCSWCQSL